ncbi:hypothetical protein KGF57_003519 [Candida theae]|uniref:Membrane insertase YidC/Oxa/ALB C-terminal domain-containing protein n=1 Tax=Candida theae TaxID=1198502 RepID=A0AAD5BDI3_9ASCO|nr:uncharacterized protein KGF57_003519 [Candida theae]KAI5956033.1 hypothetical protein KGF57_003519 [Candida theae]
MFKVGISRVPVGAAILRNQLRLTAARSSFPLRAATATAAAAAATPTFASSLRYNSSSSTAHEIKDKLVSFADENNVAETVTNLHSDQIGYLESIGLAQGWGPTSIIEKLLEFTHVYTGLPWWGTIAVLTVAIRVVLFPLYVKASSNATRMSEIKPQLDVIMKQIKGGDTQDQLKGMEKRRKLMKEHNVSTLASMAPIIQLPLAYGFFQALRKMANHPVEGFTDQGLAWFTNLSDVDPYLGLQAIAAAAVIAVVRIGGETGQHAIANSMKQVMTIVPIISIFITKNFSAAVVLYFAINSVLSLIQSAIFKSNTLRQLLGMPKKLTIHQLNESTTSSPKSLKEMVTNFVDESKERSIKAARDANKRLEVTQHRKAVDDYGYIKKRERHDKRGRK